MGLWNCTADGPPFGRGQSARHFFLLHSDCLVWVALNHLICIRVASVVEDTVYEVIATPQEQPEQAQEERRENPAQGPSDPSSEQQSQGKPRCITPISNYAILIINICLFIVH